VHAKSSAAFDLAMNDLGKNLSRSSWLSGSLVLGSLVLVIGVLYLAREIFIPIALAILLTFILAPMVTGLRRRGFGRTWSVLLTVALAIALLSGIAGVIFYQLRSLADDLPAYRQNISQKINDLRLASRGGSLEKVQETVKGVLREVNQESAAGATNTLAVPVRVTNPAPGELSLPLFGPFLAPLATSGLVTVLIIFMLLRREDLRDRLLRLAGYGRLVATTKAIDEAGKRVSKYLLRQFLINSGFGIVIGLGLFAIGLPYAILWGVLAAVARFIPYAGPVLGGAAPILMSLAVFDSWTAPLMIVGLVIVLELIQNLVVEPLVYGQSIGVSEVALLIMIAFWTWLWGSIGLVLAAPLTVCLMVICKSVPDLEFIGLLLSSEPALEPHHVFYQRLVAKDEDEAREIVDSWLKEHSRMELFEQLLIPTLISCRRDGKQERLSTEDQAFVFRIIRQILEEAESASQPKNGAAAGGTADEKLRPPTERPLILGCPANDEADELALLMLAELLRGEQWSMRVLSSQTLSSERISEVEKAQPTLVCLGFLPHGPVSPLRQFCKRLRARFPNIRIVLGRWGAKESEKAEHPTGDLAQAIGWSLAETQNQVVQFAKASSSASALQAENPAPPSSPG